LIFFPLNPQYTFRSVPHIFLSLTRQLLYLLPCLLLFPNWWGLEGIWISMPVSDALAFITAVISLMIYIKKVSKQHPVVAE